MNNKPVAWWTGKYEDEGEDFMFPNTRQAHIDHPQSETHIFFPIPLYTHPVKEQELLAEIEDYPPVGTKLYTHPVKELTDEELYELLPVNLRADEEDAFIFARAILRKASEK